MTAVLTCKLRFTVQASGPIDISSDEELESAEPRQPGGQSAAAADTRELRRSTRSNAHRSTAARFEVGGHAPDALSRLLSL